MKILLIVFLSISSCVSAQDWIPLFNGKNTDGWQHVGEGNFIIDDGLLKTNGGMGLLWYTGRKFGNAKIRIIYRGADKNNSGVFIRIPETPTEPWMPVNKGYEVQLDDREDNYHKTGTLYSLTKAKAVPGIPNKWNTMEIILDGNRTIVHINGILVTDYAEGDQVPKKVESYEPDRGPRPIFGYIGIQNHGDDDFIEFKEISYKDLEK